jgi:septin family protein
MQVRRLNDDHVEREKNNNFFRTHLQDLKDVTSDVHYESFRAQQLLGKRNLNNIYE